MALWFMVKFLKMNTECIHADDSMNRFSNVGVANV